MRIILIICLIVCIVPVCYGERVSTQISTGKLIELQSDNPNYSPEFIESISGKPLKNMTPEEYATAVTTIKANRLNAMKQNAINLGYNENDIEVLEVTSEEFNQIKYVKVDKPNEDIRKVKDQAEKQKKNALKNKLKSLLPDLTNEEIDQLLGIKE